MKDKKRDKKSDFVLEFFVLPYVRHKDTPIFDAVEWAIEAHDGVYYTQEITEPQIVVDFSNYLPWFGDEKSEESEKLGVDLTVEQLLKHLTKKRTRK